MYSNRIGIILAILYSFFVSQVCGYSLQGLLINPTDSQNTKIPVKFDSTTEIILRSSSVIHKTFVRSDESSFRFLNVSEGSYILNVNSVEHIFPVLKIDVMEGDVSVYFTHRGNEWSFNGPRQPYPIELKPMIKAVYLQERETFSIFKLLKNPMLLISLASLAMVFIIPKMTENMDPEALKEIQQSQINSVGSILANPTSFDMASYLAGKSSTQDTSSSTGQSSATTAKQRK
ncbi:hypothetical protein V1511DRAFT_505638 [Dipodascopsis uninucleata]